MHEPGTVVVRKFSNAAMASAVWGFDLKYPQLSKEAPYPLVADGSELLLPGEFTRASRGWWAIFIGRWRSYIVTNLGGGRVEIKRKRGWGMLGEDKKIIILD